MFKSWPQLSLKVFTSFTSGEIGWTISLDFSRKSSKEEQFQRAKKAQQEDFSHSIIPWHSVDAWDSREGVEC